MSMNSSGGEHGFQPDDVDGGQVWAAAPWGAFRIRAMARWFLEQMTNWLIVNGIVFPGVLLVAVGRPPRANDTERRSGLCAVGPVTRSPSGVISRTSGCRRVESCGERS